MTDGNAIIEGQPSVGLRQRRRVDVDGSVVEKHNDEGMNGIRASMKKIELESSNNNGGGTAEEPVMPQRSMRPSPEEPTQQQQPQQQRQQQRQRKQSVVPLSMQLMRPFWLMSACPDPNCFRPLDSSHPSFHPEGGSSSGAGAGGGGGFNEQEFFAGTNGYVPISGPASTFGGSLKSKQSTASNDSKAKENELNERNLAAMNKENYRKEDDGDATNNNSNNSTPDDGGDNAQRPSFPPPGSSIDSNDEQATSRQSNQRQQQQQIYGRNPSSGGSSFPMNNLDDSLVPKGVTIEQILLEYTTACRIYGCSSRINAGVLTTLRFGLPTLRVSGSFFDADMLALTEVLLKHCNGALKHVKRLDFTIAGKEGRDRGFDGSGNGNGGGSGKKGMRSHGAYALSKVLCYSAYVEEVYLTGNRIGPYGASAIFTAAARNAGEGGALRTLLMRGCRIGERGALRFAKEVCGAEEVGLREVDLSANRIGFLGCYAIEEALKERVGEENSEKVDNMVTTPPMMVDVDGNMIFQEVMNCITHGLGMILGIVGTCFLGKQIAGQPSHWIASCAIYSTSVITLYTSSTLFHSFFALKRAKFIFQVFDRCAIYLLIAGSYTPFLMIPLHHKPQWSVQLLLFIWACAISGVLVEALCMQWKHKGKFSLAMYLGMGWSCMVCLPDLIEVLPANALGLIFAGGVAYTGGVPFFVRNNNLDHSIWHLFVLAGSMFHWFAVFWYVANPAIHE